ncbi:MAG: DUF4395 domain-containing protein [Bifidobacteriaceae bacterium]|jgi:hypothetical protein|nr:DUF4395 domain-containing protein [Bifidobacteriaceae bacterium]
MPIDFSCPISGEQRDNTTARIVAGLTFVLAVATVALAWLVPAWIPALVASLLATDFAVRAFAEPKYSPLATLARGLGSAFHAPRKPVDAAPKVFAARLGLGFSVVTAVLLWLSPVAPTVPAATVVASILALCAFLESALGFCLGCWVYALLPHRARSQPAPQ